MKIRTELLRDLTIRKLSRLQEVLDLDPPYQREGGVWDLATSQRLIDSVLNGLDLPKLYFERASTRRLTPDGLTIQYAVVDGKQRIEALLKFLRGNLALADDFWFFEDETVVARGLTLTQLETEYPVLAQRFFDYDLPIVSVITDSGDLIEEMFQRLNASSALNAAERRNAVSGATRDSANALAQHALLTKHSPIRSARYKYRELGAKFLAIEHQLQTRGRLVDTKAATLYDLFTATHGAAPRIPNSDMESYRERAAATLDRMKAVFTDTDPLLSSIGTIVVYYIAFRHATTAVLVDRPKLIAFEEVRRSASSMAEDHAEYARPANARLREYNVYVQSTNDGAALSRRAEILTAFLVGYQSSEPLSGLDGDIIDDVPTIEVPDE